MKAYTTLNYNDLYPSQVRKIGVKVCHITGRNNGLLYNGLMVLSVPMNGPDFTIKDYLEENPDIVNCGNDLNLFIETINKK